MSVLNVSSVVDLKNFGLPATAFSLKTTAFDSDRFVACQNETGSGRQLTIVDLYNNNSVNNLPLKADAGSMDVENNIVALRMTQDGGTVVQVFDLDGKSRLAQATLGEAVVFQKWVCPKLLALVTAKAVYHWNLQNDPVRIFELADKLAESSTRIINYAVDGPEPVWCMLTGLYVENSAAEGAIQLFRVGAGHQILPSPAGCFGELQMSESGSKRPLVAFVKRDTAANTSQVIVMPKPQTSAENCTWNKVMTNLQLEDASDFCMSLILCDKTGLLYLSTNKGMLYAYDAATLTLLTQQRISEDPLVCVTRDTKKGGILTINKKGVLTRVVADDSKLIQYISNQLQRSDVATSLALRFGYPGCEDVIMNQFRSAFARGDYRAAAEVASKVRSGALRTPAVIREFKNAPAQDGTPAITTYFAVMLEKGRLNAAESLELVQPAIAHSRVELIERWLREDKLECTSQLGELVKPVAPQCASAIFAKAGEHQRVVQAMAEAGKYAEIPAYIRKNGNSSNVDFTAILRTLTQLDRQQLLDFAKQLLDPNQPALCDPNVVFKTMVDCGRPTEACAVLLEYLRPNRAEHGAMQTLLLKTAIQTNPQMAEAVFQMNIFTHYDRPTIATECERAGMTQRALEHHTDMAAIRRCMLSNSNMGGITLEWLSNFFQHLSGENIVEVLGDLLKASRANSQLVLQASLKFHEKAGADKLAAMMEAQGAQDAAFALLNAVVATSTDGEVVFKFVQTAARLNQITDLDRVLRENKAYDAVKVKDFLKEAKLADARPLIYVCNENGFVEELTEYLYKFQLLNYLEIYCIRVNPKEAPRILGCLIDLDAGEDFLLKLLTQLRGCDAEQLMAAFLSRSRIRLLAGWLEQRINEGSQEAAVHNALAMIAIDGNRDAEEFLKTNSFYDPKVIGAYCEDRDPHLACVAYRRRWGTCDEEFVRVANKNSLFRVLSRYCVERQNMALWQMVLSPSNPHRNDLVEHVTTTALPESTNAEEVAAAVKAFIAADLPEALIELLEKIVLHNPEFQSIGNLQTLLISTAIRVAPQKVLDYVSRLAEYDGVEIAKLCCQPQFHLFEEAFVVFGKFDMPLEALKVLLENLNAVDRAYEFAARLNSSEAWLMIARDELHRNNISAAVDCYIKANDGSDYLELISIAEQSGAYEDLVRFLTMARNTVKDAKVDTAMVYAMARCDQLSDNFFEKNNTLANLQAVGDRLFDEKAFAAARVVFQAIPNNARLASTLVQLGSYEAALEAAGKARNPKVWKELCLACIQARQFNLAQDAGQHVITHPDHLEELVKNYEEFGYTNELISLLSQGITAEGAHPGLFTELGIQYVKHKPSELSAFAQTNAKRLNLPKLIRACEQYSLWKNAVELYVLYGEADQAIQTMIAKPDECFDAAVFEDALKKITNVELFYRVATFYLQSRPQLLSATLSAVSDRLDHARMVNVLKRAGGPAALKLVREYLLFVQKKKELNIKEVNEALNDQHVEGGDPASLRWSVENRDNFDQLALAAQLESHAVFEFRSIAVTLYRQNKKFKQAMSLAQQDRAFKEVLEVAKASAKAELVEELLRSFAAEGEKEAFAAALYVCYELVKPEVVMELEWTQQWTDVTRPFWIQHTVDQQKRLEAIEKKLFGSVNPTAAAPGEKKSVSGPSDLDANVAASMMSGLGPQFNTHLVNGQLALTGGAPGGTDPFRI